MSSDTSLDSARNRIQRLVGEIVTLSKAELTGDEFFQKYIERVVEACDAKGGAVWLVGQRPKTAQGEMPAEFQLCAQVEFGSSLFQSDEGQRASLLKILTDVANTQRPTIFSPAIGDAIDSSAAINNRTPYPFLHVPLMLKDQIAGVLQVWLQPYVAPNSYQEFITFLQQLAAHVEQHLQSRRLGNLVLETQRLQHLLRFSTDIVGTLDAGEVARLAASYARDLMNCERCSVLAKRGDRWEVLAISGQELVEKKSAMVKAMAAFVEAHAGSTLNILNKTELLDRGGEKAAAPETETNPATGQELVLRGGDVVDLAYFEVAHVMSAAIQPLLNAEQELVGALFCESTVEGSLNGAARAGEIAPSHRMIEWLGNHTSRGLGAARDYQTLPLLRTSRALRASYDRLTGEKRKRTLFRLGIFAGIALIILLFPLKWRVEGDCVLQPVQRAAVSSEIPGRIEQVFVEEGDHVKKGQPLAQLDPSRLETELQAATQEKLRNLAEADRLRAPPVSDEASAQVAQLQAAVAEETEKKLRQDIASATLRAPFDGVVLTKGLKLHTGEFVQAGTPFTELAALDRWQLEIDVPEKEIGLVERALEKKDAAGAATLPLDFVLYSQTSRTLHAALKNRQQISATAYAREHATVFVLTIPDPEIPEALEGAMRPGLTGRAKIQLGWRPLAYVWGSRVARWFQLHFIG